MHTTLSIWDADTYPVALEGALKLKEISYIHAEGYPAAEMKHGPIALVDAEMPVVVIATQNGLYEKVLSNIQEIKARKGRVIAIVTKGDTVISKIADTCIELPETIECLDPLITTVPLQLLAYQIGRMQRNGCGSAEESCEVGDCRMRTCTIYHLQCTMGLRLGGVNVNGNCML